MRTSPTITALTALLSCAGLFGLAVSSSAGGLDSGIRGHVLYGPTCPVQRAGQNCTRPYQATITVRREPSNIIVARVRSAGDGSFSLRLRPGRYVLQSQSGRPYPRSSPQTVTVQSDHNTAVTIRYDSGIR